MPGSARDAEVVARHGTLARRSLTAWAMLVYLFLFAPVALLVLFSFNANRYGTLPITGWTTPVVPGVSTTTRSRTRPGRRSRSRAR